MEKLIESITTSINTSNSKQTRRKLSVIKKQLGVLRLKQTRIDELNDLLTKSNLSSDPKLISGISDDTSISFKLLNAVISTVDSSQGKIAEKFASKNNLPKIIAPEDFFKHLFSFESDNGYDKFQACLDSNSPIALFIIPKSANSFYSSVIPKILSYELIRKRQYKLDTSGFTSGPLVKPTTKIKFDNTTDVDLPQNESRFNFSSDIFEFSTTTMESVILAKSGEDLIESEKFENQFNQLSILANRYINNQFFVIFNCPPIHKLKESEERRLDKFTQKINQTFPFVYKLESKFATEEDIPASVKNEIALHFKLLNELPNYTDSIDGEQIPDIFSELQKSQIHYESQVFHNISPQEFKRLCFGRESDEHIYLKFFAIKSLQKIGYKLDDIVCELNIKKAFDDYESTQRADVAVKDEIIVEIETLRGKTNDKDVYLALAYNILSKSKNWNKLKELWLTIPGFEVARNYYQLQKTQELLQGIISNELGSDFKVKICSPDYQNCELVEIDFSKIPKRNVSSAHNPMIGKISEDKIIEKTNKNSNLDNVIGLDEEKNKLNELVELIEHKQNLGINGILFYGLPGCGKTYLANCFAETLGWSFFSFSPADIISMWLGQTQHNIKDIFNQARQKSPSILFIDEIDSIGFNRNTSDAHTDQKATINQLLIELNKLNEEQEKIIVIGATNNIKSLDPALKRSGRFDYKIHILPPDTFEREKMFEYYLRKNIELFQLSTQDFKTIASKTKYFTSSDIKSVCNSLRIQNLLGKINQNYLPVLLTIIDEHIALEQITLTKDIREKFIEENENSKNLKIITLLNEWSS